MRICGRCSCRSGRVLQRLVFALLRFFRLGFQVALLQQQRFLSLLFVDSIGGLLVTRECGVVVSAVQFDSSPQPVDDSLPLGRQHVAPHVRTALTKHVHASWKVRTERAIVRCAPLLALHSESSRESHTGCWPQARSTLRSPKVRYRKQLSLLHELSYSHKPRFHLHQPSSHCTRDSASDERWPRSACVPRYGGSVVEVLRNIFDHNGPHHPQNCCGRSSGSSRDQSSFKSFRVGPDHKGTSLL